MPKITEKLKTDITQILSYFEKGLADVEAGSGTPQPMLREIRSAMKRLNKAGSSSDAEALKNIGDSFSESLELLKNMGKKIKHK